MPDETIDKIFRAGSGQQWDPDVVDAFFRARERIREIIASEQDGVIVDLPR
jgi:response regulator RpfG family c-di-GMP phosphodiesterase